MSYEYISPIDKGYKRFYLSRRLHNQLFPLYKTKWHRKYEYYYCEHDIRIDVFVNNFGILANLLLLPVSILWNGLGSIKEITAEVSKMLNEKETGSFYSWNIWSTSDTYRKVMEVIKCQS